MEYFLTLFTFLFLASQSRAAPTCEDVHLDCARLDIERNICADPLESSVYCARHCGHCTDTVVVALCEDNDQACSTMANPTYCSQEQGRQMCPKSCNTCKLTSIPEVQTTSSPAAPANDQAAVESNVNLSTSIFGTSASEIPDPNCQDIDNNCFFHVHECFSNHVIRMLCQRSCDLCPSDNSHGLVNTTDVQTKTVTANVKVLTLTRFEPTNENCFDHDRQCAVLIQTYQCQTDLFLPRLCPESCGLCNATLNKTAGNQTELLDGCADYDPECPSLMSYCASAEVLVSRLCRQSCKKCYSETLTTTAVPMAGQSNTAVSEDCFDLDPKCETIALGDTCQLNDLVSRVCPVTCKVCNETRSKPLNDTECLDYDPDCHTLQYACGAVDLVDRLCPFTCSVCKKSCHICSDPFCDGMEQSQLCPADQPYCLNSIMNEVNGKKHISKTCGTATDCVELWVNETSHNARCKDFHADGVYLETFSCHFCCQGENCNSHIVPLAATLFKP